MCDFIQLLYLLYAYFLPFSHTLFLLSYFVVNLALNFYHKNKTKNYTERIKCPFGRSVFAFIFVFDNIRFIIYAFYSFTFFASFFVANALQIEF